MVSSKLRFWTPLNHHHFASSLTGEVLHESFHAQNAMHSIVGLLATSSVQYTPWALLFFCVFVPLWELLRTL